ncbi:hypothetical protein [Methylophilus luteus]|uniref:Heparinase II/III-like protein n=1 Tax=Methylophilus luteus TaxID=640108 RepID=A0ABW3F4X2_9PROT
MIAKSFYLKASLLFTHAFFVVLCLHPAELLANENAALNEQEELYTAVFRGVRLPEEHWPEAKSKVTSGEWKTWYEKTKKDVDYWIKNSTEQHSSPVGWAHDYIDVKTGKFLFWAPTSNVPNAASDKIVKAWRYHVRSYNIQMMVDAAKLYRLTGDDTYQKWVLDQLKKYSENYAQLPLNTWNGSAQLFNQSLDEAVNVFPLLEALRILGDQVNATDRKTIYENLFLPMSANLIKAYKGENNISVWQATAITAIGLEFYNESLLDYGLKSPHGVVELFNRCVNDNFWNELSFQYQDYVVRAVSELIYAAKIRNVSNSEIDGLAIKNFKMMISPALVGFKNEEAPMLNDSQGKRKAPNFSLWASLFRIYPTYWGSALNKDTRNWDVLIDTPPAAAEPVTLPPPKSRDLNGLLASQLVNGDWHIMERYGQYSRFHAHQDALSYDLQFKDDWVFKDAGTVGYGSPLHTNFFKRAHSSNAPIVDYDGQAPWPSRAKTTNLSIADNSSEIFFENYRKNVNLTRTLKIENDSVIDKIRYESSQPHTYGVVYNTACEVVPDSGLKEAKENKDLSQGPFKYWKVAHVYQLDRPEGLQLNCNNSRFSLRFSSAKLQRLVIAKTPDTQGNERNGIYIETSPTQSTDLTITLTIKK